MPTLARNSGVWPYNTSCGVLDGHQQSGDTGLDCQALGNLPSVQLQKKLSEYILEMVFLVFLGKQKKGEAVAPNLFCVCSHLSIF